MNKTLTVILPGESHDDYSWALKLSDGERLAIAENLLHDLWQVSSGQPYPTMDRTIVHLYTSSVQQKSGGSRSLNTAARRRVTDYSI